MQFASSGRVIYWSMAAAIVMAALLLRLDHLALQPLTVDEATLAGFARGVLEKGYPFLMVGGMEVPLATYELVPYFLAASVKLFGYGDFALRLPALFFGVSTCALVITCAGSWFGRMTGLLSGLLYAISPWAIYWSQNCFHPAQTQFFALVAIAAFFRLLSSDNISLLLAVVSAFAFGFSYLSWEGTGLILPIMALVAICLRWSQWRWFAQVNLWLAGLLITIIVAVQAIRRLLLQSPYTMIGSGKSDMAAPKLTFTQASYEPWYYLQNFFLTETHLSLTLFFVAGLFLMFRDHKLSFVLMFVVMAYLSLTNLLGYYNAHYFYFVLPVYLIAVAAVFISIIMRLADHVNASPGLMPRIQGVICSVLLTFLLLLPSGGDGLQLYRIRSDSIERQRVDYRPGLAGMDARSISRQLSAKYRTGDVIISTVPLISEHYAGLPGDYFIQTITDRKVVYDTEKQLPYYVDKFVGNPVLRSGQELQEMLSRHSRVWLLAAPIGGLNRIIDQDTLSFINRNMSVVAESYDSRLYLWER